MISLFLCVFAPFIHCVPSSLPQSSIRPAALLPPPAGVLGTGDATCSSGGCHLCFESMEPCLIPRHCKCLQVPRRREKRELPGSLKESGTGGKQPRSEFQSETVPLSSCVSPGSSLLPCLCVSVHLFPCLCTTIVPPSPTPHVHLSPAVFPFPPLPLSPPHSLFFSLPVFLSSLLSPPSLALLPFSPRDSPQPHLSLLCRLPSTCSVPSLSLPWHSLSLCLPLPHSSPTPHLSFSFSTSLYLAPSFPRHHRLPQNSHMEIGAAAAPLPHALVSPLVGWSCPLPRIKEEGPSEMRDPQRVLKSICHPVPLLHLS